MAVSPTQDIISDIKAGKMVILVDAEERENEGDLIMAAQYVTHTAINFMAKHARGLICLTLSEERCKRLNLSSMVAHNSAPYGTDFTVSIEARQGVTTGVSAADRARTIQVAVANAACAEDLVQPGHIFPLKARNGGVLVRAGHTEAGSDLAQLAGLEPAAVICEIMNDDGSMARLPQLIHFAKEHGLKIGSIADLIQYRSRTESLVERVGERQVETPFGQFRLHVFRDAISGATHLALVKGQIREDCEILVRVHEPLSILDLLAPQSQHHSWALPQALETINRAATGVVILLHSDETAAELLARVLPTPHKEERKWDGKTFGIGAQMLRQLGVSKMCLMAAAGGLHSMSGFGLEVTGFCQPPIDSAGTVK